MQEQCNRIIEWQDEVKKVHEAHKQKLLEAKEHIDKVCNKLHYDTIQLRKTTNFRCIFNIRIYCTIFLPHSPLWKSDITNYLVLVYV